MWIYVVCLICLSNCQSSEEYSKGSYFKADEFPIQKAKCSSFTSRGMAVLYQGILPCKNYDFKPFFARKPWTEILQDVKPQLEDKIQGFSATSWEKVRNYGYVRSAKYGLSWQDPRIVVFEQQEMNNDTTGFVFRSVSSHVDLGRNSQLNQELVLCGLESASGYSLTAYGQFFPSERPTSTDKELLNTMIYEQVKLLDEFGSTMEIYCQLAKKKPVEMIFSRKMEQAWSSSI